MGPVSFPLSIISSHCPSAALYPCSTEGQPGPHQEARDACLGHSSCSPFPNSDRCLRPSDTRLALLKRFLLFLLVKWSSVQVQILLSSLPVKLRVLRLLYESEGFPSCLEIQGPMDLVEALFADRHVGLLEFSGLSPVQWVVDPCRDCS